MSEKLRNDSSYRHHARHAAQRLAPGVEVEGRHQLHAVFLSAGGGRVQFFVRSERGRIAPDRRWPRLGGVPVRGGGGSQPDVGTRYGQRGCRRLPGLTLTTEVAVGGADALRCTVYVSQAHTPFPIIY